MKRRLLKHGVFLLLFSGGAIVNVAVAWGCAFIEPHTVNRELSPAEIRSLMAAQRSVDWGDHDRIIATELTHLGHSRIELRSMGPFLFLLSSGWPLRSIHDEYAVPRPLALTWITITGHEAFSINVPHSAVIEATWPASHATKVIWPGFAINTIFYAAMLWLLWIAPGKIRRFIRVHRGRCPACAYPVGTSPVCTECGHPLTPGSSS